MFRLRHTVIPLVLVTALLGVGVTAAQAADPLLSRNRPATSSSVETSSYSADKAFDGSTSTRWASREGHDPEWIQVDLGAVSAVSRVKVVWEAAYAKSYNLAVSNDGTTWTRIYSTTSGDGGTDDRTGLSGAGRYVRLTGTQRGTSYGYSAYEVEVYGTPGPGPSPSPSASPSPSSSPSPSPSPTASPGGSFVVAAAGDIAEQCTASSSSCQHPKTAQLVAGMNPKFVITMGDNQYDDARLSDFRNYYDTTWGAFKAKTKPAPGNHETYDPAGFEVGYKDYFGAIAFPQGKSYYSYDQGNWHFLALDSNLFDNAAQLAWLKADLAANTKGCVAAYWHHPLFSSGDHGNDPVSKPVWDTLYAAGTDLILNGHDHHYERFGPQSPTAKSDPKGPVEILGGMGGANPYPIVNVQPNSLKRITGKFGVLKLTFSDNAFSSQLIGVDNSVLDTSPTYTCH
ncbi:discoidin domain-containing protein [Longispora sp. K20-0274]|uniref:discoidin domain-containing protein n=1 Tax=Longispora sp. K20-0274 TaxID=3088255 RepID=UPI00399B616F